ncbi:MAG: hypothetical protein K6A94_12075 [Bacteroidales bacterium]|nr:hypothetical protein [Bacteroidales bacterium]
MNPKTKKIIIIAIVAAVVGYLLWKRSKQTGSSTTDAPASGSGLDKYDVDDVIKAAGITGTKATLVRKEANYLNSTLNWRSGIEEKAQQKGRTYEQQLVIEALYAYHYKKADADWKISSDQFKKYWQAIDAM